MRKPLLTLAAAALRTLPACAQFQKTPIRITADLSDGAPQAVPRGDRPARQPGMASFITPQSIPGDHAPNGPIAFLVSIVGIVGIVGIVDIVFTGNGLTLAPQQ